MKIKTHNILLTALATRPMWGMIPLRAIFGVILILEGLARFTLVRNGAESILSLIPGDVALAIIIFFSVVEILGGLLSILGFSQRLVGLLIVIEMSFSIVLERIPLDYSRDFQTQVLLFGIAAMLLFSGAGRYSLDRYLARKLLNKYPNKKKHLYMIAETPYTKWWE